jgi:phosphatidylserine/phosphatidylglycerophosphate/cardiolipin synthase-like enzyme
MRSRALLVAILLALGVACALRVYNPIPRRLPPIEVYFSPRGGCTDAVVREIRAARHTILVQAYSFTSTSIARALDDAHKRGVRVKVLLDKEQTTEDYSLAQNLHDAGIPLWTDAVHAHAHNKVMILDGEVVITGSFNFTHQAEHGNAENLLVVRNRSIARQYEQNWADHAKHSEAYSASRPGHKGDSRQRVRLQ